MVNISILTSVSILWRFLALKVVSLTFQSRTIRDFDERFTAKVFGYPNNEAYYTDACIDRKIHDIKVPLLCLNAADDPFAPGPCKSPLSKTYEELE